MSKELNNELNTQLDRIKGICEDIELRLIVAQLQYEKDFEKRLGLCLNAIDLFPDKCYVRLIIDE